MFSKITAFLHQAAEVTSQVLAPQLSRPEEFQGHWRAITDCITTDTTDVGLTVQSVGIPRHLQTMADLLFEEEEERDHRDPGTMGPCMEFLLRHKILDTLYTTGNSDYPTGMKHEVLLFFTVLLGRLEKSIVPQVSVHQPMQKLICECGKDICGPLALDEIQFLRTLTLKLHEDPRLADFFLEDVSNKKIFVVAEALLRLVHNQDNVVMMKSYECLLTCSSLDHLMVSKALGQSQLPMLLASQLQCHFQLIPSSLHYTSIMNCNAGWGVNYATRGTGTHVSPSAHDVWHVEAFLSWLDYCEQLVSYAAEPLADAVCEAINELLLTASLLPRLSKSSEEDILQNTAILTRSVQALSTQKLLEDFVLFALSGSPLPSDTSSCLREKLIQRIDHVSDEVCQVTLQLFDVLLHTPLSSVVHQLVLQGREESQLLELQGKELMVPVEHLDTEKQQLQEDVKSYLSLVSDSLSSCDKVTGDAGLEHYLVEAHRQVATCRAITLMWGSKSGHPTAGQQCFTSHQKPEDIESPLKSNLTAEGCSEEELCLHRTCNQTMSCSSSEGPFLAALLTKLERLLDQPYEVNLLLTSILSRLAAFPLPLMDQWLFSIHCDSRNVYSILKKVSSELQSHADRSPGLVVNIVEARRRLAGMETSDLLSMPHNDLLEGAIVLEEFSKELAATLFAKKTTSMLMIPAP